MALIVGSQLSVQSVLYNRLWPAPSASSSLASALTSQFYGKQASLILNRDPAETRVEVYQEALRTSYNLVRSSFDFFSDVGYEPDFAKRTASSSDESKVRVYAQPWATTTSFQIEVLDAFVGEPRTIISNYLDPEADWTGPDTEEQTFRLSYDSETYFDMTVDTTESNLTNSEVLNAMANEINSQSGIGVTATVNFSGSQIYLDLTADGSVANTFTLEDTGTGTLLSTLRLEETLTADPEGASDQGGLLTPGSATNIRYRIDNDEIQESDTLELELENGGIVLWLLDHTTEPVTITVEPDVDTISSAVQYFMAQWNDMWSFTTLNPGELTTPLANDLNQSVSALEYDLYQIGISRNDDGTFSVDTDELESAISSNLDDVSSLFAGAAGIAMKARQITEDFLTDYNNVAKYVDNPINPVDEDALRWISYYETRGLLINTIG